MSFVSEMKLIKETRRTTTAFSCDFCGVKDFNCKIGMITYQHYDWANDSEESIAFYHYCSLNCFFNVLRKIHADVGKAHPSSKYSINIDNDFLEKLFDFIK